EETRKSAEFMEVLFEEAGASFRIEGDARTKAEQSLCRLAITNLLDNALRHGETGGAVTVTIEDREKEVAIGVSNPAEPIEPERLQRIFDRFYRDDPARSNSTDTHGLGLAIVKAIAQMHGGSVYAHSQNGVIRIGFTLAKSIA
ncbi:MAG: ATP-binding protein, partial [Amphiplicatus sp.]